MKIIGVQNGEEFIRDLAKRLGRLETGLGVLAQDRTYPSFQRPNPVGRPGIRIFDLTQGRPLWSNGVTWVDSEGVLADYVAPNPTPDPPQQVFVGTTAPTGVPTGVEYVWFHTDGAGGLVATVTGIG